MIQIIPNWHPIFVHFSVALLAAAAMLYVSAIVLARTSIGDLCLIVARFNLFLGAGLSFATVAAGMYAFLTVPIDDMQRPLVIDHRNWALVTALVWWSLALWEAWRTWWSRPPQIAFVLVAVLALLPLGATGWKGAELVYRHGVGVLPASALSTPGGQRTVGGP